MVRKAGIWNSFVKVLSCKYTSPLSLAATGDLHCPPPPAFSYPELLLSATLIKLNFLILAEFSCRKTFFFPSSSSLSLGTLRTVKSSSFAILFSSLSQSVLFSRTLARFIFNIKMMTKLKLLLTRWRF
jgi:hypothetical protein